MKKNQSKTATLSFLLFFIPCISYAQEIQKLAGAIGVIINGVLSLFFFCLTFITTYKIFRKNSSHKEYQIKATVCVLVISCIYYYFITSSFDLWFNLIYYVAIALPLIYIVLDKNKNKDLRFWLFVILIFLSTLQLVEILPLISILLFISILVISTLYLLKIKKETIKITLFKLNIFSIISLFFLILKQDYVKSIGYELYEFSSVFVNAYFSTIIFYFALVNFIIISTFLFYDTFNNE